MKTVVSVIISIFACCNLSYAQSYDVYLCIGQSNMAGRGTMMACDSVSDIEGVFLLSAEGRVEPARNPLNKYSSIRKELQMQQISPAMSFAQTIHSATGRKVLLVVNARGGSSIDSWQKGADDGYYEEAVRRVRQAMLYGELRAVLWHQGESDLASTESYMRRLNSMVEHLREELERPRLPFIVGEIGRWVKGADKFNQQIRTVSEYIPYSGWVSSDGLSMRSDILDPHFSRNAQLELGQRYAKQTLKMVNDRMKQEE